MKIITLLFLISLTTPARSEEWINYFTNNLVSAEYDRESNNGHTMKVRWTYKDKQYSPSDQLRVYYRFKAYCSTQQLFSILKNGLEREVEVAPETLYEATWMVICGIH
ncbi:MAG: hypothetical protein PHD54_07220 [Desulfuromonadaceae bacterium]|nr:hypothetical protein [Desulfuromonadaceae bacterium]